MGLFKTGIVFGLGFVSEKVVKEIVNDPDVRRAAADLRDSSKELMSELKKVAVDAKKDGRIVLGEYAEKASRVCGRVATWAKNQAQEPTPSQEPASPQENDPEGTPPEDARKETPAE